MEARCVARYIRVTPRKMRLVADLVRGKNVNEAIGILKFTARSAALPTLKAIQSAVANIVNRDDSREVDPDTLWVKTIFVDEGPTFRRYLPRAMGRATPIRKRMSHVTVTVAVPEAGKAAQAAPAVEAAPPKKKRAAKPAPRKTKETPKTAKGSKKVAAKRSFKKKKKTE